MVRHLNSIALVTVLILAGCAKNVAVTPALAPLPKLRADIEQLVATPELRRTSWAVLIQSLDRADTFYTLNADKLMMPASNMKIVTLAAAAERLGWDYRYTTRILAAGGMD